VEVRSEIIGTVKKSIKLEVAPIMKNAIYIFFIFSPLNAITIPAIIVTKNIDVFCKLNPIYK